jgi:lipoprotein-anchoring transpeptidase ErfK/SrfK
MRRMLRILIPIVVVLLAAAGTAWAVDNSRSSTIASGVTVAGVPVGGLSVSQAQQKVAAELEPRVKRAVVVTAAGRTFELSPRRAGVSIDVDGAVRQALARSRSGWIGERLVREVSGGSVNAAITPGVTVDRAAVEGFSKRVAAKVDRTPVEPHLVFTGTSVSTAPGTAGLTVSTAALTESIASALAGPSGGRAISIRAATRTVAPKQSQSSLAGNYPSVITVDRATRQLYLFKYLKHFKTLPVAVGMAGLETPPGLYSIQDKQVDPVWHVPNSAWAGALAGKSIPPGPENPIKARWMGLAAGVGIHGTADDGSIGSAASHGCVRMHVSDVIWLYDQVSVGTPVYIS